MAFLKIYPMRILFFLSKSRVPNERELYGLFVKALLETCGNDLSHIATEFQVIRANDDSEEEDRDSKGRVDLIFDFRSVSFAIEFKVCRVNALKNEKDPKNNARKSWLNANKQLQDLNVDSLEEILKKEIVKLPIVLYIFESRKLEDANKVNLKTIHDNVFDFMSDGTAEYEPDFELFYDIEPAPTRLRKTKLDVDHNNYIYGFSIFAKQLT